MELRKKKENKESIERYKSKNIFSSNISKKDVQSIDYATILSA